MVKDTLRLAWRNLGRNRRRSVITGLALAIGVLLSVVSYGVIEGASVDLLHSLTRFDLGHLQIHHQDFPRTRKITDAIDGHEELVAQASSMESVRGVTARIHGYALASHGTKSLGVQMVGVDPETEPRVTELHKRIVAGSYLPREPTPWPRGRKLTQKERAMDEEITERLEDSILAEIEALEATGDPGAAGTGSQEQLSGSEPQAQPGGAPALLGTSDEGSPAPASADIDALSRQLALAQSPPPERPPGVLMGATLARVLKVKVGDSIHVASQTADAGKEEVDMKVMGIYRTGTDQFDRRLYLHFEDMQRFMHLYGRAHEIAVITASPETASELADTLRQRMANDSLLVRPWNVIRPDMQQMIQVNRASSAVIMFIIFFVATLGVVNTMLMAVFERTREFSMLKAIGMSSWRIVGLVVAETILLVLIASGIGTLLGLVANLYLMYQGVDISFMTTGFSMAGIGVSPVLHGVITIEGLILPTVILSFICLCASLYPALRAARLRPAVGMRET